MRSLVVLWIVSVLVAAGVVHGQAPVPAANDIGEVIRDLGSSSSQVRKQARSRLAEIGWPAKPALEEATRNPDPEVAATAGKLLAELLPGVTGRTPERQRQLVVAYTQQTAEPGGCLDELCREDPVPYRIVLALFAWEQSGPRRPAAIPGAWRCLSGILPLLRARADLDVYEDYLAWAIRMEDKYRVGDIVAYASLQGNAKELRRQVVDRAANASSEFLLRLQATLHLALGERDEAVAVASEVDDWEFLEDVLIRAGTWRELAEEIQRREPEPSELRRLEVARAFHLAGDDDLANAALAHVMAKDDQGRLVPLVKAAGRTATAGWRSDLLAQQGLDRHYVLPAGETEYGDLYVHGKSRYHKWRAWHCLLATGFTGDAVQLLLNEGEWRTAAIILAEQRRYDELIRVLQEAEETVPEEQRWLPTVRRAEALRQAGDPSAEQVLGELLDRCRTGEVGGGDPQTIKTIFREGQYTGFDKVLADRVPGLLTWSRQQDEKIARELAWATSGHGREAMFWWDCLEEMSPGMDSVTRATRIRDLLRGDLSAAETKSIMTAALREDVSVERRVAGLAAAAVTYAVLGRQKEAEETYQLAEACATEAGDDGLLEKVYRAAREVYGPVANWHELARAAQGVADHSNPGYAYFRVHAANFLAWQGDREAGRRIVDDIVSRSSPSSGGALFVLEAMTDGEWNERRRIPPVIAALVCPLPPQVADVAWDDQDYGLFLRMTEVLWDRAMPPVGYACGPEGILGLHATLAYAQCQVLVTQGRIEDALAKARCGISLCPGSSRYLVGVRDQLRAVGAAREADELVRYAMARDQSVLERFPDAPEPLNDYAWLAAHTGLEMEQGEVYIRRAVKRAPERSDLLETLAILTYRQGKTTEGVELMRQCVRMDPSFAHLHRLGRWLERERKKAQEGR